MFPMMTPIDAISYGLRAGMVLGQTQTLWATRILEMQGFWLGFPALVSDMPKVSPSPLVTELHVEAMAGTAVHDESAQPPESPLPPEAATSEPPASFAAASVAPDPMPSPRRAAPQAARAVPLAE